MGMGKKVLKKGITCKLNNKTDPGCPQECVGDFVKVGRKMLIWSAHMEVHITVLTMPLYWRNERGHGRLGVTLTSLGKM